MLLDYKNQYLPNDYATQGNPQNQCNLYQITSGNFHRTRIKNLKVVWRHKRTQIAEAILSKRNETGVSTVPSLTSVLTIFLNLSPLVRGSKEKNKIK